MGPFHRVGENPTLAIDRDLETICLAAMEKDPQRRYSSAGALAADLSVLLVRGSADAGVEPVEADDTYYVHRASVECVLDLDHFNQE